MSDKYYSWCPQCGLGVDVDEDGCCVTCGATANGDGVEAAITALRDRDALQAQCAMAQRFFDSICCLAFEGPEVVKHVDLFKSICDEAKQGYAATTSDAGRSLLDRMAKLEAVAERAMDITRAHDWSKVSGLAALNAALAELYALDAPTDGEVNK